jgi:hypothetical protein
MDMVRDQARRTITTEGQQRKIERDKTRARRGNVQRKRLHVLRDGKKYLNLGHTLIAKNTLSGATSTKNSLQSGIEINGSQTKRI